MSRQHLEGFLTKNKQNFSSLLLPQNPPSLKSTEIQPCPVEDLLSHFFPPLECTDILKKFQMCFCGSCWSIRNPELIFFFFQIFTSNLKWWMWFIASLEVETFFLLLIFFFFWHILKLITCHLNDSVPKIAQWKLIFSGWLSSQKIFYHQDDFVPWKTEWIKNKFPVQGSWMLCKQQKLWLRNGRSKDFNQEWEWAEAPQVPLFIN